MLKKPADSFIPLFSAERKTVFVPDAKRERKEISGKQRNCHDKCRKQESFKGHMKHINEQ